MWNRQQVKEQAKQIMKRNYWKMFVVTLIAGILSTDYVTVIQEIQDFVPDVVLPSMLSSILSFLSMGMSNDYTIAIEEGATHIRLGSILFQD